MVTGCSANCESFKKQTNYSDHFFSLSSSLNNYCTISILIVTYQSVQQDGSNMFLDYEHLSKISIST